MHCTSNPFTKRSHWSRSRSPVYNRLWTVAEQQPKSFSVFNTFRIDSSFIKPNPWRITKQLYWKLTIIISFQNGYCMFLFPQQHFHYITFTIMASIMQRCVAQLSFFCMMLGRRSSPNEVAK